MPKLRTNTLYYGDNLEVLRDYIPDDSVDLIYLDPPFNSNRSYNVLFKEAGKGESPAQIEAFEDTWHPGESANRAFEEVAIHGSDDTARLLKSMVDALGHNDVTAYLSMMAVRLIELHRVLKPAGSMYLHCDPTASHYLKVLMDSIFEPANFVNEIIWKRSARILVTSCSTRSAVAARRSMPHKSWDGSGSVLTSRTSPSISSGGGWRTRFPS